MEHFFAYAQGKDTQVLQQVFELIRVYNNQRLMEGIGAIFPGRIYLRKSTSHCRGNTS
jgi:hypothetical protein